MLDNKKFKCSAVFVFFFQQQTPRGDVQGAGQHRQVIRPNWTVDSGH